MGEFTGLSVSQETDRANAPNMTGDVETDVADVKADGLARDGLPIFTVSQDEFFKNMKQNRNRLRFGSDTTASQYMRKTRYRRPFWIRDEKGGYMRKVK